ncbi:hypothetical protein MES5069_440002 [Mesorhizobium escarrei]|uniref:Uncharacterized protein n=1 Tax=Mesorhizobium escarrei TaxID=666018 RepID=A0ABN8K5M2_9HYPH|nr:hypothetical protein MES5069_440002 [Mesorhizobium escarrei]
MGKMQLNSQLKSEIKYTYKERQNGVLLCVPRWIKQCYWSVGSTVRIASACARYRKARRYDLYARRCL